MPAPLIPIVAVVALIVAAAAAKEFFQQNQGKTIAIVGPRKSGKTTLVSALRNGTIKLRYKPTNIPTSIEFKVDLAKLQLKIRAIDVSGEPKDRMQWDSAAREANLVCFVVSAEALLTDEGYERARKDAAYLSGLSIRAEKVLILSHPDKTQYNSVNSYDVLKSNNDVQSIRQAIGAKPNIIVANLVDPSGRRYAQTQIARLLNGN